MYELWRPTSRHLTPIIVSITHLLARKNCTYDETDWIIEQLQHWIKDARERREYATCIDYHNNHKTASMDNVVITPIGHVDDNLNPILKDGTPYV